LTFVNATRVQQVDITGIPKTMFKFKDFAEILAGNYKPDYLVGTFLNLYTALYIHPLGKSDTFITSVVIVYIADAIGVVHDIRKVVTGMPGRKSNVTFTMKDLR
jgi:hypothetical protein